MSHPQNLPQAFSAHTAPATSVKLQNTNPITFSLYAIFSRKSTFGMSLDCAKKTFLDSCSPLRSAPSIKNPVASMATSICIISQYECKAGGSGEIGTYTRVNPEPRKITINPKKNGARKLRSTFLATERKTRTQTNVLVRANSYIFAQGTLPAAIPLRMTDVPCKTTPIKLRTVATLNSL